MRKWLNARFVKIAIVLFGIIVILVFFSRRERDRKEATENFKEGREELAHDKHYERQFSSSWEARLAQPKPRSTPPSHKDSRFHYRMDGFNEFTDAFKTVSLLESAQSGEAHLAQVDLLMGQYYWAFKQVPVGSENAEITLALLGDNPKFLIFIPHDSSVINEKGELLDYWGTPYYFHPVSEKVMEVRSLGPDKKLWTADDLIHE